MGGEAQTRAQRANGSTTGKCGTRRGGEESMDGDVRVPASSAAAAQAVLAKVAAMSCHWMEVTLFWTGGHSAAAAWLRRLARNSVAYKARLGGGGAVCGSPA